MAQAEFTDAIAMLKADHREVEALFEKFENARGSSKQGIAEQICNSLKVHAMIEEEIFYPALENKIEASTTNEAYVEHDAAKVLINDILSSGEEGELFEAKVKVLSEEIKHHVQEEEARAEGMFAQAREAGVDLVALRDAMMTRKQELLATLESGGLPEAELRVVNA